MPILEPLTVHNQFPGYPVETLPDLTGMEDCSWHNDTCPSWRVDQQIVWIDWPNRADREDEDGTRFVVQAVDPDGCLSEDEHPFCTDDWADVQAYLETQKGEPK